MSLLRSQIVSHRRSFANSRACELPKYYFFLPENVAGRINDVETSPAAVRDIQGVPGGKDLTSGECSLGQTIPI